MKVLVIRFSSIGDIVLTSPVVRCIKQQIPQVEIHYLTKKSFYSLLQYNPNIHRTHLLDEDLHTLIADLKQEQFDLVIDLHKNLRSNRIIRKLKAKAIQYNKLNIRKWLFTRFHINTMPPIHLVDRYFDALKTLPLTYDGLGLEFYLDKNLKLDLEPNYLVYAIGGTYATKRMRNEQIAELLNQMNLPVYLIGGLEDAPNAKKIIELSDNTAILNRCGQWSIQQSARCIAGAQYLFCHDSGMMHIGAAFNVPMSVIWGNTHPDLGMYPFMRQTEAARVVNHQVELSCRPCSKLGYDRCPRKHFNCMNNQNVDEIVKNCDSVVTTQ